MRGEHVAGVVFLAYVGRRGGSKSLLRVGEQCAGLLSSVVVMERTLVPIVIIRA